MTQNCSHDFGIVHGYKLCSHCGFYEGPTTGRAGAD